MQSAVLLLAVVVHTATCLIKVDTTRHLHRPCRFMAPETLRSEVYPASDVWAAGVTAHQLLTGRFPFDDRSNPFAPSLSKVW